jgi:hypothetical protein
MANKVKTYHWDYGNKNYTLEEYIIKIQELFESPLDQMFECDGDLFMSEYQKLRQGYQKLSFLVDQLKEEKE